MRILILTDEIFPDAIGGVGKSVMTIASAWVKQNHQVTVVVRRVNPNLPLRDTIKGVNIIRFPSFSRSRRLYRLYPLCIIWHVTRWLRAFHSEFDVVILQQALYMVPIWLSGAHDSLTSFYNFHAPVMLEIEIGAGRNQYGHLAGLARLVSKVLHRIENWALRKARHIIIDGHRSLSDMRQLHGPACFDGKTSVISLGVDTDFYKPQDKYLARQQLGLPPTKKILFTARRLVGRVGLENLITAMVDVQAQHPDACLFIAGQGFLRSKLEQLIIDLELEDYVQLLGFVAETSLPVYIAASDLFVLPTEFLEGFGLATIEALACGVPVVGTPIGTTPELLSPIEPTLITKDSSPSSLAETIIFWFDRPNELETLRHACRQAAEDRFAAHQIAQQLVQIFESVQRTM